jgi:hypothetical protein
MTWPAEGTGPGAFAIVGQNAMCLLIRTLAEPCEHVALW